MATSTATTNTSDTSSKTQSHGLMATVRLVQGSPALACMATLMIISVVLGVALLIYTLLWPSDNPKHAALRPTVTPDDDNTTMNGTVEASPVAGAVSDGVAIKARRHTATLFVHECPPTVVFERWFRRLREVERRPTLLTASSWRTVRVEFQIVTVLSGLTQTGRTPKERSR
ncbi:hypothetical protein MRX96_059890 [Rhipicephalus microplus]